MLSRLCLLAASLLQSVYTQAYSFDVKDYQVDQIIRTDVAIVGGGSSGTYTGVRLKDEGHNVVIVEKLPQLGGHAQTYTDPLNNYTIDIGVIVFGQTKIVNNYFKRFNIPLITFPPSSSTPKYVNPNTGQLISNFTPPSGAAITKALQVYSGQLARYPEIQNGFNLSYPVAEELLQPFGTFLKRHKLEALFPLIFTTNQGFVPILEIPTLYMLKYLNPTEVNSIRKGFQTTKNHNIFALYENAAKYLGSRNLLFSSHPIALNRTSDKVSMVVDTPNGRRLIISKKIVSAIPPTIGNLGFFDLTSNEKRLFSQFYANGYVTSVLNNTGLSAANAADSIDPSRQFNVPSMPNPYSYGVNAGTNLTQIYYGSPRPLSNQDAKSGILSSLKRYQQAQGIKQRGGDFVAFSNHAPFNLMVSTDAIKDGFYQNLTALNGQKNTYWNGAAFQSQDSTVIWDYTENVVLPLILKGLER